MESSAERAQGYRKEARKYAELASSGARRYHHKLRAQKTCRSIRLDGRGFGAKGKSRSTRWLCFSASKNREARPASENTGSKDKN
jgi:hypothetical protein